MTQLRSMSVILGILLALAIPPSLSLPIRDKAESDSSAPDSQLLHVVESEEVESYATSATEVFWTAALWDLVGDLTAAFLAAAYTHEQPRVCGLKRVCGERYP